jgi:hypothetical protein
VRLPRIGGKEYGGAAPIAFINGVWQTKQDAIENGGLLGRHFKAPVDVLWNPSQGKIADLLQVMFVNKQGIVDASTRLVITYMKSRIKTLKSTETLTVVAHSQGAAIASAALSYLSPRERSRVTLKTYGDAACTIPGGLACTRRTISATDIVPMFFGGGRPEAILQNYDSEYSFTFMPPFTHALKAYLEDEEYWASPETDKRLQEQRERRVEKMWDRK